MFSKLTPFCKKSCIFVWLRAVLWKSKYMYEPPHLPMFIFACYFVILLYQMEHKNAVLQVADVVAYV